MSVKLNTISVANIAGFRDHTMLYSSQKSNFNYSIDFSTTPATFTVKAGSFIPGGGLGGGSSAVNVNVFYFNTDYVYQMANTADNYIKLDRSDNLNILLISEYDQYGAGNFAERLPVCIIQSLAKCVLINIQKFGYAPAFPVLIWPYYSLYGQMKSSFYKYKSSLTTIITVSNGNTSTVFSGNVTYPVFVGGFVTVSKRKITFTFRIEGATPTATSYISYTISGGSGQTGYLWVDKVAHTYSVQLLDVNGTGVQSTPSITITNRTGSSFNILTEFSEASVMGLPE